MSTATDLRPWQASILEQLEQIAADHILDDPALASRPYLVIGFTSNEEATLLERCTSRDQADTEIAGRAGQTGYEHIRVEELASIGFTMPETTPAPDPDGKALFDASDYDREDLAIPKVDGNQIDKIRFAFSGSVLLDRSEIADVALFNGAKLGQELELRVSAKVAGVGTGFTTNKDGDLDVIVGEKKLKIETVWVLDPEDLG